MQSRCGICREQTHTSSLWHYPERRKWLAGVRLGAVTTQLDKPTVRYAGVGSKYFGILLACMSVIVILSNIGGSKGVAFGPIITDGGFFLFPFAYIIGDITSEIYGLKVARKAIITTFILSAFASACYWIMIVLPGFSDPDSQARQAAFETTLGPVPQIVLASLAGFLVGQLINSLVMTKLKARQGERRLWLRLMSSSGIGEFFDTLIFCAIAASVIGITTFAGFLNYFIVGFIYKVALQYILVPVTSVLIAWIKRREPSYQLAADERA